MKSSISFFINELLIEDGKYFSLERGAIGNRLVKYYSNKKLDNAEILEPKELRENFKKNLKTY